MPKQGKKKESNLEFQKRTFPGRLRAVERRSAKVLGERGAQGFKKPPSAEERVAAKRARKAASRIRKRLGVKKKGMSFSDKASKTVEGLKELFSFGKRVVGAPGAFRGVGQ